MMHMMMAQVKRMTLVREREGIKEENGPIERIKHLQSAWWIGSSLEACVGEP